MSDERTEFQLQPLKALPRRDQHRPQPHPHRSGWLATGKLADLFREQDGAPLDSQHWVVRRCSHRFLRAAQPGHRQRQLFRILRQQGFAESLWIIVIRPSDSSMPVAFG